ncbi:MAG: sigma-70 family RNA polymerase sigma factor [Planctomycetes bacterium]|nr:sigma-70 family RNA polymerase sigma factor [Planctomycetota bacterium]
MSTHKDYQSELVEHARRRLGPASARLIAGDEAMDAALRHLSTGGDLGSTALKVVYERLGADPDVDNEFATYLTDVALSKGRYTLAPDSALRRLMNTADLANSVIARFWPRLSDYTFDTEEQFVALLVQRMDYHVRDRLRGMNTAKRSEHRRVDGDPALFERIDDDPENDPELSAIRNERLRRLQLIVTRLLPKQRAVFTLIQKGMSTKDVAAELDISTEAVRQALQRAIEAAASLLGRDREG